MAARMGCATWGLLESALGVPQASFGGEYLHPSIPAMAAAYLFHITQNHPFFDGNKRTGANAAITFLLMNDLEPTFDENSLVELVLAVTQGAASKGDVGQFLERHSRPFASN